MDINPWDVKTSSQHMIIWSHDYVDQKLVETKSFKCTFCRRGFSNAQALGGHMNIHRKDRAKLKLELSLDFEPPPPPPDPSAGKIKLSTDESPPLDVKDPAGLSLFNEAAAADGDETQGGCSDRKLVEMSCAGDQLDLELRLGPDPVSSCKVKGIVDKVL